MASLNQPDANGSVPHDRARRMHEEMIKISYAPFQCHFIDITDPNAELPYNTRMLAYMAGLVISTTENRDIYRDLFTDKFRDYTENTHTDPTEILMTRQVCMITMNRRANDVESRGDACYLQTSWRIGAVRRCMDEVLDTCNISAMRNGKPIAVPIPGLKRA